MITGLRRQQSHETLSEFAWRVIDDIFRNGTEEQKRECVKSFYQRVHWEGEVRLRNIFGGCNEFQKSAFVLEKDGYQYRIEADSWKYREGGKPIKDANLSDMIGVPTAFLDGIALAVSCVRSVVKTQQEQEEQKKLFTEERKKLESAKRLLDKKLSIGNAGTLSRESVVKSLRRAAEKEIAKKQINTGIASAEKKYWKEITRRCNSHDMPPVPKPNIKRSDLQRLPAFSGLYFEWHGLLCNYVGKSVNVPARVKDGHHKLQGDSMMSFLPMDMSLIGRSELFYIWLLNPASNGGL